MPKVKITGYIKEEVARIIEVTEEELDKFRLSGNRDRIIEALTDCEGIPVSFETIDVESESWELIEESRP